MRVTGDHVHRPYLVWRAGIMDRAPGCIDHTVVAMDVDGAGDEAVLTMVMRDVGELPGSARRHGACQPASTPASSRTWPPCSGAFWGWEDDIGLTTMAQRLRFFAPDNIAAELAAAEVPAPVAAAAAGWDALPGRSPLLWQLARLVHDRPEVDHRAAGADAAHVPARRLEDGQSGHPPGRAHHPAGLGLPGAGPACWDLCWYLALNRARLPEPKEAVIGRFRAALEQHGIDTGGWWQRQLDLCLIGIMATFGWEKALGDADELAWWEAGSPPRPAASTSRSREADDHRPLRRSGRRWATGAELVYGPIAAELVA